MDRSTRHDFLTAAWRVECPEFDDDGPIEPTGSSSTTSPHLQTFTASWTVPFDCEAASPRTCTVTATVADAAGLDASDELALTVAPESDLGDGDGDGLSRGTERALGTDPCRADSDGDGKPDGTSFETLRDWAADTDVGVRLGGEASDTIVELLDRLIFFATDDPNAFQKQDQTYIMALLLRRSDGCGTEPDADDWVLTCDDQRVIQDFVGAWLADFCRENPEFRICRA